MDITIAHSSIKRRILTAGNYLPDLFGILILALGMLIIQLLTWLQIPGCIPIMDLMIISLCIGGHG